jgi:hypothetical protein
MGLFDFFKRRSPIRDGAALGDFIDRNAAFVVQKGLYEYSRARAGHYAKVLFADKGFHAAVENSRWRAYPLGLAMVAEVADNVLHSEARDDRAEGLERLSALVLSVFDRYPVPAAIDPPTWSALRVELERRLKLIGLHPPKRAMDIPATYIHPYFDLMPIHEKLRGRDFPTTHNYLQVVLCNVHEELSERIDLRAFGRGELAPAG